MSNNIELCRTLKNLFQGQIPKSDSFYAKIDYLNLPVRHEFSGTKPIRIEEIEEKIISKLTENGHPIKDIHMRHFTDRYTLEVMRIRDKEGYKNLRVSKRFEIANSAYVFYLHVSHL